MRTLMMAALLAAPLLAGAAEPVMEVYKSPTCGCCTQWIAHLRSQGLRVHANDVGSPGEYRRRAGIADQFSSCHTGVIGGYAIEGHVPAADVARLLREHPRARGLAAPGMPAGSPGMEGARHLPYDVYLAQADGQARVYRHHD